MITYADPFIDPGYDDTSVNGAIVEPEREDEEGPPWDCDASLPEESDDDDEDE